MTEQPEPRRTIRRYAHELYPHPEDGEIRPLDVDVPYLYAQAIAYEPAGTSWHTRDGSPETSRRAADRIMALIRQRQLALIADALLQGLVENEAWQWAQERAGEESSEWIWERAAHYGIDWDAIKPYPCGPEPDRHEHLDPPTRDGSRMVHRIQGKESDCPECTEPEPTALAATHTEGA